MQLSREVHRRQCYCTVFATFCCHRKICTSAEGKGGADVDEDSWTPWEKLAENAGRLGWHAAAAAPHSCEHCQPRLAASREITDNVHRSFLNGFDFFWPPSTDSTERSLNAIRRCGILPKYLSVCQFFFGCLGAKDAGIYDTGDTRSMACTT